MGFLDKIRAKAAQKKMESKLKKESFEVGDVLEMENELLNYFEGGEESFQFEKKDLSDGMAVHEIYFYDDKEDVLYILTTDALAKRNDDVLYILESDKEPQQNDAAINILEKVYRKGDVTMREQLNSTQSGYADVVKYMIDWARDEIEIQQITEQVGE